MRQPVAGKTVLITGAARGIGADVARRLASRGARVVLAGLEPDELEQVAGSCGKEARSYECDVTDVASIEAAVAATVEWTGGIDVLVPNSGIAPCAPVRSIEPAVFERAIEVNLLGAWRTVRAALPSIIDRRGYILPIASLAAIAPYFPGFAAYSASKAGLEAFASALRGEVAHLGVDVGVAYFSWIDTQMVAGAEDHPAFVLLRDRLPWPNSKTYPVTAASAAIVRGIERRARVVVAPRWVAGLIALRGIAGPLFERLIAPNVPEAAALFEADFQRRGSEAGRPGGAGGAADTRAAALRARGD